MLLQYLLKNGLILIHTSLPFPPVPEYIAEVSQCILLLRCKYSFIGGLHILNCIECLWIKGIDQSDYISKLIPVDNCIDKMYFIPGTMRLDKCGAITLVIEDLNKLLTSFAGKDPDHLNSHCQLFLDDHAYQVTCGKTCGISNVIDIVVEVLHYLAYSHDPDQHLKKTEDGSYVPSPLRDKNYSHSTYRLIADSCEEYQQRHDKICEDTGIEKCAVHIFILD